VELTTRLDDAQIRSYLTSGKMYKDSECRARGCEVHSAPETYGKYVVDWMKS